MPPKIPHWHSTFVVDTTDVQEQKIAAISAYQSQFPPERLKRLLHRVQAWDALQGGRCGFEYGELFALPHPMPLPDPVKHFEAFEVPLGPPSMVPKA